MLPHQNDLVIYDLVPAISMTDLKKWGYCPTRNQSRSGVITWTRGGQVTTAQVSISVRWVGRKNPLLEIFFHSHGKPVKQEITFTSVRSSLGPGRGSQLYFKCPFTKKRCLKLLWSGKRFSHRSGIKGLYLIQNQSRKGYKGLRALKKAKCEDAYKQINRKHFKAYYNGVHTRRYRRLMKRIAASELFTARDIERLYLS